MSKEDIGKLIITEDGKIEIKGNFNRNALITLLRKELRYQEELERLEIKQGIQQKIGEKDEE